MKRFLLIATILLGVSTQLMKAQERKPEILLELFTSERCSNCPTAVATIQTVLKGVQSQVHVSWISHHAGYMSDFLTLTESIELLHLYKIGGQGIYAPAFMLNRGLRDSKVVHEVDFGNVFSAINQFLPDNAGQTQVPLEVQMQVSDLDMSYNPESRQFRIRTTAQTLDAYSGGDNFYLNVALTEDKIQSENQAGAYSDYVHMNALRKLLAGANGLKVDPNNAVGEWELSIPDDWKVNDMKVIVFAHRDIGSAANLPEDPRIYGSAEYPFPATGSSISIAQDQNMQVYAQDGNIVVDRPYLECKVYDLNGRMRKDNGLEPGLYVVRVETQTGIYTHKVMVD